MTETTPLMFKAPDGETIRVSLLDGGHTAVITDQWRELDPRFHKLALGQGAITNAMPEPARPVQQTETETEPQPKDLVRRALIAMLERSEPNDFTSAGMPDLRIARGLAGINADRDLIYAVWAELQSEAGSK